MRDIAGDTPEARPRCIRWCALTVAGVVAALLCVGVAAVLLGIGLASLVPRKDR